MVAINKIILIIISIFASLGLTNLILEFFQTLHWRTCSVCGNLIDTKNDNYCSTCGAEIVKELT